MWRRFRYYLKKDFPMFEFQFNKINDFVWEICIPSKNIILTFSVDFDLSDTNSFNIFYSALKQRIKNSIFKKSS